MPVRDRGKRASGTVRWPARAQDNQPITVRITGELLAPVEARVAQLETEVAAIEASFVTGAVESLELELPSKYGGTLYVGAFFHEAQVGAPVVVSLADTLGDQAEFGIVQFVASVVSTRAMRFRWFGLTPAPRRVTVNFIIGAREE